MNLEDRIRRHYESQSTNSDPVDLTAVLARGTRLRRRAHAGTALFSIAGLALLAFAAGNLLGTETVLDDTPVAADPALQQEIDESWKPVPDRVDPELAAAASTICPFDQRALSQTPEPVNPAGPAELLVIDQRGITATVIQGMRTTTGEVATTCSAIRVDGVWRRANEIEADWPALVSSSGSMVQGVTEIRLRFPDGTEVTGSVGNEHYFVSYPATLHETLTEPNSYVYMDQYVGETLVGSEFHMSSRDLERIEDQLDSTSLGTYPSQVGTTFPDLVLEPVGQKGLTAVGDSQPTIVTVWAPWCVPCREQLLVVQRAAEDSGVGAAGISVGTSQDDSAETVEAMGITFPNGLASESDAMERLGLLGLPATFVVDDGVVKAVLSGTASLEDLQSAVEEVLK